MSWKDKLKELFPIVKENDNLKLYKEWADEFVKYLKNDVGLGATIVSNDNRNYTIKINNSPNITNVIRQNPFVLTFCIADGGAIEIEYSARNNHLYNLFGTDEEIDAMIDLDSETKASHKNNNKPGQYIMKNIKITNTENADEKSLFYESIVECMKEYFTYK